MAPLSLNVHLFLIQTICGKMEPCYHLKYILHIWPSSWWLKELAVMHRVCEVQE